MNYLLDTCIISEMVKKQPNLGVIQWINDHDEQHLFISIISIGEISKGIHKLSDVDRKKILSTWLKDELLVRFEKRIITLDVDTISVWGKLTGEAEQKGQKLPVLDSLIAATALAHSLVLVTRNITDFERCNVIIENPFD